MKRVLIGAALRQTCFGLTAVALSLPLLWTLHRRVGVDAPSTGSVLLLGASVVVAFVGGGVLGAALHEFGRGTKFGRNRAGGWIAASGGLIVGVFFCIAVASIYGQSIVEGMADEGASMAWSQRDALLHQTRATAATAAKELAGQGAARLPVLVLLVWALLGPMIGAALEYRLAARPGAAA